VEVGEGQEVMEEDLEVAAEEVAEEAVGDVEEAVEGVGVEEAVGDVASYTFIYH